MIDDSRVERMAREYEMSPQLARKLLEEAREQPAAVIRRVRRYAEVVGGEAVGTSKHYDESLYSQN